LIQHHIKANDGIKKLAMPAPLESSHGSLIFNKNSHLLLYRCTWFYYYDYFYCCIPFKKTLCWL